ncbi:MAG TPA: T9SS type A sorting domain-containing protein, partial [Flavobacteriales bacterium]|nr:T9SS type A sorting domain-containing protein [Flavobacteriales bacterium]
TGLKNGHWYTVTVTDGIGCTENDYIFVCDTASGPSFTYVVYGQDSVVFTNTSTGNGDYGLIFGAGGGSLSNWAPGTNHTYTYGAPGTYNVCIIDTLSCAMSFCDSVTVDACNMINTITGNPVSCNGATDGSLTVTLTGGTGPYTYLWSSGATGSTISNLNAGTYTVTITDSVGCSATATGIVTEPPLLVVATIADSNVTCNGLTDGGASAFASGVQGFYGYLWNNGATNSNITNVGAGTYSVTITDSVGCSATATVIITEPNAITLTMSAVQASCNTCSDGTATVTATGGTPPYSYLWNTNPAQTTSTATGLKNGYWYTVNVTDNNGCIESNYIYVCDTTSIPSFTYVIYGQDSVVFTNTSSGNGKYDLSLGDGNYLPDWALGTNLSYVYNTTGTYNVCLYDTLSCTAIFCDTVVISVTGMETEHNKNSVLIYPNPTSGLLTIEGIEGTFELYNILGKLIQTSQTNTMNISQGARGIYLLKATDGQGRVYSQKIIKE